MTDLQKKSFLSHLEEYLTRFGYPPLNREMWKLEKPVAAIYNRGNHLVIDSGDDMRVGTKYHLVIDGKGNYIPNFCEWV